MTRLLERNVTVPFDCRGAEPYTSAEIDCLPEPQRSRVWATILAMRAEAERWGMYHLSMKNVDLPDQLERGLF